MLQQDALFLEYDEASRAKVQQAFRLPDLYIGKNKDFNRATADTARQVAEEQVFEPERAPLEFIINNKLLEPMNFAHVSTFFKGPEISNVEEQVKLLDVLNKIGSVAPNDVRDVVAKAVGKDELDLLPEDLATLPLLLQQLQQQAQQAETAAQQAEQQMNMKAQADKQKADNVKKSLTDSDLVDVLKTLRDEVEQYNAGDNAKY